MSGAAFLGSLSDPDWNAIPVFNTSGMEPIPDTTGASSVNMSYSASGSTQFPFGSAMEDSGLQNGQLTLSGLDSSATYELVLYSGFDPSFFILPGESGTQSSLPPFGNYEQFTGLTASSGSISVSFSQLNGFQLQATAAAPAATSVNLNEQDFVLGQHEVISASVTNESTMANVMTGDVSFIATDQAGVLAPVSSPSLDLSTFSDGDASYNFGSS